MLLLFCIWTILIGQNSPNRQINTFTNEVRLHAGIIGMAENKGLLSGSAKFTHVSHPFKSVSLLSLQRQTIMIHAPSHKTSEKWWFTKTLVAAVHLQSCLQMSHYNPQSFGIGSVAMLEETIYLFSTRSLCSADDAQPWRTGVMEGPGEVLEGQSRTTLLLPGLLW